MKLDHIYRQAKIVYLCAQVLMLPSASKEDFERLKNEVATLLAELENATLEKLK
jgi:hypothetical protein